jgi:hypothetical protein
MSTFAVSDVAVAPALFPESSVDQALRARLASPFEACGANLPVCATPDGTGWEPLPHHGFAAAVHHAFAQRSTEARCRLTVYEIPKSKDLFANQKTAPLESRLLLCRNCRAQSNRMTNSILEIRERLLP